MKIYICENKVYMQVVPLNATVHYKLKILCK
uniref:Uncharacterized protein n=1 Tax=Arundo donax TaxID=35708 RepID=A0A0A9HVA3_ARUDO